MIHIHSISYLSIIYLFHTEKTPIMNIYGIVHVLPKILYSEGLHMENFKSKFVTAEAAVAAAVKDGDWVD